MSNLKQQLAYSSLEVVSLEDSLYLCPTQHSEALQVDRKTFSVTRIDAKQVPQSTASNKQLVYGILGSIKLLAGNYLVVVTERKLVGTLANTFEVYRMTGISIIPVKNGVALTSEQQEDENEYLQMIRLVLESQAFYFSYTFNMTSSFQSQMHAYEDPTTMANLFKKVDEHFFWNRYLAREFIIQGLNGYILPVIRGFVEISSDININGELIQYTILSRQSCQRAGTRYNVRGIDAQGNVANYAETEQIVLVKDNIVCFVQNRGSIPLHWTQNVNLKYKPKIELQELNTPASFRKHFDHLVEKYKHVVAVNLIDQKGSEKLLADKFKEVLQKHTNETEAKYIHFDFHKECSKNRYERIEILLDNLKDDFTSIGYFIGNLTSGKVSRSQYGVFRVNCIDCLDRTNVVQSTIAEKVLQSQLRELGVLSEHQNIKEYKNFQYIFKNVWADNADALSFLYSGTGALKTDFTRTGKRSMRGTLNDGYNSVLRYYLNNFTDGYKQDAINLITGRYIVDTQVTSPFVEKRKNKTLTTLMKVTLVAGLFLILANILKAAPEHRGMIFLLFILFSGLIGMILIKNGDRFVNKPALYDVKKLA